MSNKLTPTQIKALRQLHGLTQAQFAERLGTFQHLVSQWETGRVTISRSKSGLIRRLFLVQEEKSEKS